MNETVAFLQSAGGAGTIGIWGLLLLGLVTLIKTWPVIQQRVTEARAQQADEDGSLRTDLLERIRELEVKLTSDNERFQGELVEERRRCDEKLEYLRGQLTGITRQFVAFQVAVAQAIPPSAMTPEMVKALGDLTEILRIDPGERKPG